MGIEVPLVAEIPEQITGAWLNGLSPEQRIEVLRGPFGRRMHTWAGSHVTYIRWAATSPFGTRIRNGSMFFLDLGGRLLAITAAHVYREYLSTKRRNRRVACYVQNVEFDPELQLRGQRDGIDVVTFDFNYDDLTRIGKQALVAGDKSWPPPHPFSGQGAFLAGFPAASRLWIDWRSISFGLYVGSLRINTASDRQITCPFEREYWIDATGRGLTPRGFDLGGLSGGPLLIPMDVDGVWNFELGGIISEARTSVDYETVVSVPAHFIAPDGSINDELSAPVRHAVRAT
jgi:hypothetical protein